MKLFDEWEKSGQETEEPPEQDKDAEEPSKT